MDFEVKFDAEGFGKLNVVLLRSKVTVADISSDAELFVELA